MGSASFFFLILIMSSTAADLAKKYVTDIVRKSKEIDFLIEALPGANLSDNQQLDDLRNLEGVNEETGRRLEAAYSEGEMLLEEIRAAIRTIAIRQGTSFLFFFVRSFSFVLPYSSFPTAEIQLRGSALYHEAKERS